MLDAYAETLRSAIGAHDRAAAACTRTLADTDEEDNLQTAADTLGLTVADAYQTLRLTRQAHRDAGNALREILGTHLDATAERQTGGPDR